MKQYLLGIAAFVLAVGLSAFASSESSKGEKFQDTYWFAVDQSNISTGNVTQSDVTFLERNTGSTPSLSCNGTPTNYCLINFTNPMKVVENPAGSGHYEVSGSQAPDNISSRRQ
jgi:hypothetical protein